MPPRFVGTTRSVMRQQPRLAADTRAASNATREAGATYSFATYSFATYSRRAARGCSCSHHGEHRGTGCQPREPARASYTRHLTLRHSRSPATRPSMRTVTPRSPPDASPAQLAHSPVTTRARRRAMFIFTRPPPGTPRVPYVRFIIVWTGTRRCAFSRSPSSLTDRARGQGW